MRVPNIWNIAAILSVTTMLFSFFFALAYLDPVTFNFNPEIFAMIGFFIGFLYILAPIPALEKRKTKRFLRRSLWRQIRSPFSRVEFIDFFKESENFSFDEAREEFEEDEFSDDEIRLLRIEFISSIGN